MLAAILVPLDDSAVSRDVLPYAMALGSAARAKVLLFEIVPDPALREHASWTLAALAERSRHDACEIDWLVGEGEVAQVILDTARERRADLIAMATHSWSDVDRWLNGSVADQILRRATVPVLIVSRGCTRQWPPDGWLRILVPLDGSTFAEEALAPAREVGEVLGAELLLLRVVEPPHSLRSTNAGPEAFDASSADQRLAEARDYLEDIAGRVWATGMAVSTRVVVGPTATSIAEVAHESGADLIAMATHGRGGFARLVLGSVAMGTLQRSSVPLLFVRPANLDRQAAEQISTEPAPALLSQASTRWTDNEPQD